MRSMFSRIKPQKGSLLISRPFVSEEIFEPLDVLLFQHNPIEGSNGVIISIPSIVTIDQMNQDIMDFRFPFYLPCPEQWECVFFVHSAFEKFQSGKQINNDIYWCGDLITLKKILETK